MGNPAPLFALRGGQFNLARVFGKKQNHLKLEFENGLEGIWWRGAQRFAEIFGNIKSCRDPEQAPDMVFQVGWNGFQRKTMIEIKDAGKFF